MALSLLLNRYYGIVLFVNPLESTQIEAPFITGIFAVPILFALYHSPRVIPALIVIQACLNWAVLLNFVSNDLAALANTVYGVFFAGIYLGIALSLFKGAAGLRSALEDTQRQRKKALETQSILAAENQIDSLVHDYIVAVAVTVGKGAHVAHEQIKDSARRALDVLHELHYRERDFVTTELSSLEFATNYDFNTETTMYSLYTSESGKSLRLSDFIRITRSIADAQNCEFSVRGLIATALTYSPLSFIRVILRLDSMMIPNVIANELLLAVLESLRNIELHANALHKRVKLEIALRNSPCIIVTVNDNGKGFDPQKIKDGMGIQHSIIQRLEILGGTTHITTQPGQGTTIRMCVPTPLSFGTGSTTHRKTLTPNLLAVEPPTVSAAARKATQQAFGWLLQTQFGRTFVFSIIPLVMLFWASSLHRNTHWYFPSLTTALILCPLTMIALRPLDEPSFFLRVTILIISIATPIINCFGFPIDIHPSLALFSIPFITMIDIWLISRGRAGLAWISFTLSSLCFSFTILALGFHAPLPWDVVFRNLGTLIFFYLPSLFIELLYRRLHQQADTQTLLRASATMAQKITALKRFRVEQIYHDTHSFLTKLSDGTDPRELREEARLLEAQLRDSIAASRLLVPPLSESVRKARTRGINVRLIDNSRGQSSLSTLITQAAKSVARSQPGDEIIIRAVPPGRSFIGTIVCIRGNKQDVQRIYNDTPPPVNFLTLYPDTLR
ncbi:MAG: hypothetical protein Q4P66_00610 [Actinomycetaceae bacterium]|nr:hypothetical protein [Actinomycetaceae bacterium]